MMDDKLKGAIDVLEERLQGLLTQASGLKRTINDLYYANGEPPPYADIGTPGQSKTIRPDQFFGRPLFTAVKEYLKLKGRAAPAREIFDALKQGGYEFTGAEKLQYRGFTISLSKYGGRLIYVKPSDSWGLPEFYPGYVAKKKAAAAGNSNEESEDSDEQTEETSDEEEPVTESETEA